MPSSLPGKVIGIAKDIIDKDLWRWVGAKAIGEASPTRAIHVLRTETSRLLRIARNTYQLVAIESKDATRIGGDAIAETDASIVGGERIHDGRRKGMDRVGVKEVVRIIVCDGKLD